MHVVTCPKCSRKLKVPEQVFDAKMRCKACGETFVASSEELAGPGAAPSAPPAPSQAGGMSAGTPGGAQPIAAPPVAQPKRPIRRKKSIVPLVMVCVLVPLILVVFIVAGYLLMYPKTVVYDPQAKEVLYEGRDPQQIDAARAKLERRKADADAARLAALQGEGRPAPPRRRPPPTNDNPMQPSDDTPRDPTPRPRPGSTIPKPHDTLKASVSPAKGYMENDDGYVVGEVINTGTRPLRAATVAVFITRKDGRIVQKQALVQHVPTDSAPVRFSIDYENIPSDEITATEAVVLREPAPRFADDKTVILEIDEASLAKDVDDRKQQITLTGLARNYADKPIAEVTIFADFYDMEGRHVGSATGTLDTPRPIKPGRAEEFTLRWNAGSAVLQASMVTNWHIRVIGKKL